MKDEVEGKDTQAHVFEYTTNVVVDENGNVRGGISPVRFGPLNVCRTNPNPFACLGSNPLLFKRD